MPQYPFTNLGIDEYYGDNEKYDIHNFFDNDRMRELLNTKHIKKNYHVYLSLLKSAKDKHLLFVYRLNNICIALKHVVKEFGDMDYVVLGIFGSNHNSSDIDIGISYKEGIYKHKKLSEIVDKFESYFVNLNYTSLDMDVEMYADYFLSLDKGLPFIKTNKETYDLIFPYVLAGMLRNFIQSYYDSYECDIRRRLNNDQIYDIKYEFNLNEYIDQLNKMSKFIKYVTKEITEEKINESYKILLKYITKNYNDSRKDYYKLLNKAHTLYIQYHKDKKDDTLKKLSVAISHSLVYRAESYISAPCVYHVVYEIQGGFKNLNNIISNLGYKLSILEQLGFLYRYFIQYDKTKFKKKEKKYLGRLMDAYRKIKKHKTTLKKRS